MGASNKNESSDTKSCDAKSCDRVPISRQVSTGGRMARRTIAVGDRIGQSVVLRDLGTSIKHRRFEVTCHFCERVQIRSAGQINNALRCNCPLVCPDCRREERIIRMHAVQDYRLERVLSGGPMYTVAELDDICADVIEELEAEHGPVDEDATESPFNVDPGWPYTAQALKKDTVSEYLAEFKEREWRRERNNARFAKRDLEYRKAIARAYAREDERFAERAREAAEALEKFVAAGGRIVTNEDMCPCESGRSFFECHGSETR
jgi:hypothetical protein